MSKVLTDSKYYTDIADAIREKSGSSEGMKPSEMAEKISEIQAEGNSDVEDAILSRTNPNEVLSNYSNDRITSLGDYAFYNQSTIKTLNLPNVTSIGDSCFSGCYNLESIEMPLLKDTYEYTSTTYNKSGLNFSRCESLKAVDFPNLKHAAYLMFQYCSNLVTVNLPKLNYMNEGAFYGCSSLVEIALPTLSIVSGSDHFYQCSSLKKISCPSLTRTPPCCSYCKELEEVNVSTATSLCYFNFSDCTSLTSLDFKNLQTISYQPFYNCPITAFILRNTETICTLSTSTLCSRSDPIAAGTGYIYVPTSLIDGYKTATNWSKYATQFRALEDYTVDGTTTGELDPEKV